LGLYSGALVDGWSEYKTVIFGEKEKVKRKKKEISLFL